MLRARVKRIEAASADRFLGSRPVAVFIMAAGSCPEGAASGPVRFVQANGIDLADGRKWDWSELLADSEIEVRNLTAIEFAGVDGEGRLVVAGVNKDGKGA